MIIISIIVIANITMKREYHYVYKITNLLNGKIYIGKHSTRDLNDTYLDSGGAIENAVKKYGKINFRRDILLMCDSAEEAFEIEELIVDEDFIKLPYIYNKTTGGRGGWSHVDHSGDKNPMRNHDTKKRVLEKSAETRSKNPEKYKEISISNLKKATEIRMGQKDSDETKMKRSESLKVYYSTNDHSSKGKSLSSEHKKNLSDSWDEDKRKTQSDRMKLKIDNGFDIGALSRGKSKSEETKRKMSESAKKAIRPRGKCPRCGKEGVIANLKRWHYDRCKHKV